MARILITYSTTDGHTRRICERIRDRIAARNDVVISAMADEPDIDIAPFDKLVVGASIRYGKHQQQVFDFVARNRAALDSLPNAFFSVNVVARKAEKNTPDTNPYMRKFLRTTDWQPTLLGVFAGRIDYPSYGFFDRTMIRFILWMTKGPTDTTRTYEFTDWNKVDEFGDAIESL